MTKEKIMWILVVLVIICLSLLFFILVTMWPEAFGNAAVQKVFFVLLAIIAISCLVIVLLNRATKKEYEKLKGEINIWNHKTL